MTGLLAGALILALKLALIAQVRTRAHQASTSPKPAPDRPHTLGGHMSRQTDRAANLLCGLPLLMASGLQRPLRIQRSIAGR